MQKQLFREKAVLKNFGEFTRKVFKTIFFVEQHTATAAEHVEKFFNYTIYAFFGRETGRNERSATKNFTRRFSS